jgi:hypothetical protein
VRFARFGCVRQSTINGPIGGKKGKKKMLTRKEQLALAQPRMHSLVADHTRVNWCGKCKQDRILVITGRKFQLAWCLKCRGVFSLALPSRQSDSICVLQSIIHRWITVGEGLLLHTAEGFILISGKTLETAHRDGRLQEAV